MYPSGASEGMEKYADIGKFYGVMCKEEALAITYELSKMRLPSERKIDYIRMIKDSEFLKEIIAEDFQFTFIF